MNSTAKFIWDLIQKDEDIKNNLFFYSSLTSKYSSNNFSSMISSELTPKGVHWLYLTTIDHPEIIGINENIIYSISDGVPFKLCDGFENIPYEILLLKCFYEADNNTVEEVFDNEPEIKLVLNKYEAWCKANGIELDKDKVYHDSSGKLFTKYFEK